MHEQAGGVDLGAMSASMKAIDWFMMIGLPNALRSLAYSSEYS